MSEPTADLQQLVKHFSQGQSCIPEPRGAHAAQRRMRPRPAAPPDAWVGLAAELAEVGGRPPIDELLLQGPVGGLDDRVVARVALAGEGPPDIERLRQVVDVGVRELAAAESESAPIPSTAFTPPSGYVSKSVSFLTPSHQVDPHKQVFHIAPARFQGVSESVSETPLTRLVRHHFSAKKLPRDGNRA